MMSEKKIGEGCYGQVYIGIRKSDRKQFAIKVTDYGDNSGVPGYAGELPKEVAMMTIVRDSPCPFLIKLQEWFLVKEEKLPDGKSSWVINMPVRK